MTEEFNRSKVIRLFIGCIMCLLLTPNVFGQLGDGYKKIGSGIYHHSGQGLMDLKFTVWGKLYKGSTILDKQDINLKIIITHDTPSGAPSYRFRSKEGKIYSIQDIGSAPFEALVYTGNATFDVQVQYKQEVKSLSVRNNDSRIVFKLPAGFNLNDAKITLKSFQHASFDNISGVLEAIHKLEKDKKDEQDKKDKADRDKAEKERLEKEKRERESKAAKESEKIADAAEKGKPAANNTGKRSNSDFWNTDKKTTGNSQKTGSASSKGKNNFWNTDKAVSTAGTNNGNRGNTREVGAFVAPGIWRAFMPYNLGAQSESDPLLPSQDLLGKLYKKDDFQCPAGYRLPTKEEWEGVLANNQITWIDGGPSGSGTMIGDKLFLPASGFIDLDYGFNERARQWRAIQDQKKAEEDRKRREDWIRRGRPNTVVFVMPEQPIPTNNPGVIQSQGIDSFYWIMDANEQVVKFYFNANKHVKNISKASEENYRGYCVRCIKD